MHSHFLARSKCVGNFLLHCGIDAELVDRVGVDRLIGGVQSIYFLSLSGSHCDCLDSAYALRLSRVVGWQTRILEQLLRYQMLERRVLGACRSSKADHRVRRRASCNL